MFVLWLQSPHHNSADECSEFHNERTSFFEGSNIFHHFLGECWGEVYAGTGVRRENRVYQRHGEIGSSFDKFQWRARVNRIRAS